MFVALIVQYPVIQSVALAWGLLIIAVEYPLPQLSWGIYRTHIARIVLLLFQAFLNSLYYQVGKRGYTLSCQSNGPGYRVLTVQSGP